MGGNEAEGGREVPAPDREERGPYVIDMRPLYEPYRFTRSLLEEYRAELRKMRGADAH